MPKELTRTEREDLAATITRNVVAAKTKIESADPNWKFEVGELARKMAIGKLRIERKLADLEITRGEIERLQEKERRQETAVREFLPFAESRYKSCPERMHICEAVNDVAKKCREAAMKKHKTGKQILAIEAKESEKLAALLECSYRSEIKPSGCLKW